MTEDQIRFDADFARARAPGGRDIVFTRAEAIVLRTLAERAGRVTTRAVILDRMGDASVERTDRSVDVLVARIRRKLHDNAQEPRFIVTRYGEGYVWISDVPIQSIPNERRSAVISVLPSQGLDRVGSLAGRAADFAHALSHALAQETGTQFVAAEDAAAENVVFTIALSFVRREGALDCVLSARDGAQGRIFFLRRVSVGAGHPCGLVDQLVTAAWSERVAAQAPLVPLQVAMHEAALVDAGDSRSWRRNEARFGVLLKERGDDAMIRMMHAAHLHAKYVLSGWDIPTDQNDPRPGDEATIEAHLHATLDFVSERPDLAALSAKLFDFLDRDHGQTVAELQALAMGEATAIVSTFGTIGQLHAFHGEMDSAFILLDEALAHSAPSGEERAWILSLVCQAALAAGDEDRLQRARRELLRISPKAAMLDLIMSDADRPSLLARGAALAMSRSRANAFLANLWYIAGRLYRRVEHRERVMRTPLRLLTRRHGPEVVPRQIQIAQ